MKEYQRLWSSYVNSWYGLALILNRIEYYDLLERHKNQFFSEEEFEVDLSSIKSWLDRISANFDKLYDYIIKSDDIHAKEMIYNELDDSSDLMVTIKDNYKFIKGTPSIINKADALKSIAISYKRIIRLRKELKKQLAFYD